MLQNNTNKKLDSSFETITGGVTNINSDHAIIHQGLGYSASAYFSLASGGIKRFSFTAPESLYVHFKNINFSIIGGTTSLKIIKDATVTVGAGDELTAQNANHNATYTSDSTIVEDSTYTGGTVWEYIVNLANSTNQNKSTAGIALSPNEEHVFKTDNEQYIFEFENLTTDATQVFMRAFFYEEPRGLTNGY